MTDEERKLTLYCLKASSDYHSEVCEECIKYPNCDHTIQDDVTETIIKALEQEPCEDVVSRQAVLFELNKYLCGVPFNEKGIDEVIKELPSVTPQPTRWIPCSERLPEEEGWYLVTIQNDKTEKRRTENDLFAIGIAEAHKLTPYKFCKDGHRQTVIAWMPLPEPYKGE